MAGAPPVFQPELDAEGLQLMKDRGWDKGMVVFGAALSEATAKVVTSAKLLTSRADDFGFPEKEFKFAAMDFNDKDTLKADGKGTLGVWSPAWRKLSDSGPMPGYAMDGKLFLDSKMILASFCENYVDKTLSQDDQKLVKWWVDFNQKWQDKLMVIVSHWGWAGFHGRVKDLPEDRFSKAFGSVGKGKHDVKWEVARIQELDDFFTEFENRLKDTNAPTTGHLVAGKTTLADCAMVNWYHTFYDIGNLDFTKRYPTVLKFYKKQDELVVPDGAKEHQTGFTMFGKAVHVVNVLGGDRGCFCGSSAHDINNSALWKEVGNSQINAE